MHAHAINDVTQHCRLKAVQYKAQEYSPIPSEANQAANKSGCADIETIMRKQETQTQNKTVDRCQICKVQLLVHPFLHPSLSRSKSQLSYLHRAQPHFTGACLLVMEPPQAVHPSQEEPVTDTSGLRNP